MVAVDLTWAHHYLNQTRTIFYYYNLSESDENSAIMLQIINIPTSGALSYYEKTFYILRNCYQRDENTFAWQYQTL